MSKLSHTTQSRSKPALKLTFWCTSRTLNLSQDQKQQIFHLNFQKQGGDANNFDHSDNEDEDEKFERSDKKDEKDKQRPKEQYKEDDEDKTDQGSSD